MRVQTSAKRLAVFAVACSVGATAHGAPQTLATPGPEGGSLDGSQSGSEVSASPAGESPGSGASSSLELAPYIGPTLIFGDPANPQYPKSFDRLGAYVGAALAYRSGYFLDPFLDVGYARLARGTTELPSGPWGAGGSLSQRLWAWTFSPGVTSDIWRFRLRLGLGLAVVRQSNSFAEQQSTTKQTSLSTQFGVGFNWIDRRSLRLDTDLRLVSAYGADVTFLTLGAVLRTDVLEFE